MRFSGCIVQSPEHTDYLTILDALIIAAHIVIEAPSKFLFVDVDNDEEVSIIDATFILRYDRALKWNIFPQK